MSIVLGNQQNSPIETESQFQSWGPIPAVTNYTYNLNYTPPTGVVVTHQIKDIIGTTQAGAYTSFRYMVDRNGETFNSQIWFKTAEVPNFNGLQTINITQNGTTYTSTHQLQNLNTLQPGVYEAFIRFRLFGRVGSGPWTIIETHIHTIRITVTNTPISFTPSSLNYVHFTPTLPMEEKIIQVTGNNWTLSMSPFIIPSTEDSGVTITQLPLNFGYTVTASGTKTIKLTLSTAYNNASPPPLTGVIRVVSGSQFVANIPYNISLIDIDDSFSVSPSVLNFEAVKSIQEPTPQFIQVFSVNAFQVLQSPWLIVTAGQNEIDGVMVDGYWVVPIPTANMSGGTYQGYVDFTTTIEGEDFTIRVTVNYNLIGFISSPYPTNKAFTLENEFYNLVAEADGTYIETIQNIKVYDFFSNNSQSRDIDEKYPLFNRRAQFNASHRIHRLMKRFAAPNEEYYQYLPAELIITANQRNIGNNQLLQSVTLPVQFFFAGIKDNVVFDYAFLDVNPNMRRVYKSSFIMLNMILPNQLTFLSIKKNGEQVQEIELPLSLGFVVSKKITFEAFNQGDIITVELLNSFDLSVKATKQFGIIPEGRFSNHVIWEDEYLLQNVLEFSGSFTSKTELAFTSNELFKNLEQLLEHLEVRKKTNFTINTGWVLSTDHITVESLMFSKRVWIKQGDSYLSVRPVAKTIINKNSEDNTIDYEIEFQLNRENNAKTYSL